MRTRLKVEPVHYWPDACDECGSQMRFNKRCTARECLSCQREVRYKSGVMVWRKIGSKIR